MLIYLQRVHQLDFNKEIFVFIQLSVLGYYVFFIIYVFTVLYRLYRRKFRQLAECSITIHNHLPVLFSPI